MVEFKDARTLWARLPVQEGGGGRRSNLPCSPRGEKTQSRNSLINKVGGVTERPNVPVLKTGDGVTHPRVQISPPPPPSLEAFIRFSIFLKIAHISARLPPSNLQIASPREAMGLV